MKIKSNKNLIKSFIMTQEKELEKYKMQTSLLNKVAMRLIDSGKYDMLTTLRAKDSCINENIMFYNGMLTAYRISLTLMRNK